MCAAGGQLGSEDGFFTHVMPSMSLRRPAPKPVPVGVLQVKDASPSGTCSSGKGLLGVVRNGYFL